MRCLKRLRAHAHPHALLYHLAAHAVVLEHLDLPLISMRVNAERRTGAIHALVQHRDPSRSRMLVERDAVAAYAGTAAEEYGCGSSSWFGALEDCATVSKRLAQFTHDAAERALWEIYLRERARVMVRARWHEITVIAGVLARERAMDRASLAATLDAFRKNPFRGDLRPLCPIPWKRPERSGGEDEVVLVYTKPKLSELAARLER